MSAKAFDSTSLQASMILLARYVSNKSGGGRGLRALRCKNARAGVEAGPLEQPGEATTISYGLSGGLSGGFPSLSRRLSVGRSLGCS